MELPFPVSQNAFWKNVYNLFPQSVLLTETRFFHKNKTSSGRIELPSPGPKPGILSIKLRALWCCNKLGFYKIN